MTIRMKIVVGILASESLVYNKFKEIWISNINRIQDLDIKFYFIYGNNDTLTTKTQMIEYKNYTDIIAPCKESMKNMLRKTLVFYDIVASNHSDVSFVMRTNLSTLFDFGKMKSWLYRQPDKAFFAGSFIGGFAGRNTGISGTNTIMSRDILSHILRHQDRFPYIDLEDIETSLFVNWTTTHLTINVRRIDFIEDVLLFHKCSNDKIGEIFCFRFKSDSRDRDLVLMKDVLQYIHAGKCIDAKRIANEYKLHLAEEGADYENVFNQQCFVLN